MDAAALFALYPLTGNLAASVVLARLASATLNFGLNRHLVFGAARTPLWPSVRRYALLAAAVLTANLVLMEVLTPVLGLVVAKVLTEAGLFLAGYAVQSRLVFATPVSCPGVGDGFDHGHQRFGRAAFTGSRAEGSGLSNVAVTLRRGNTRRP